MDKTVLRLTLITALLSIVSFTCYAQVNPPPPPPKPPETDVIEDSVKTFIEEVRIPITAKDTNGRFDPTVELSDLMVRENGIVQPLKSVFRMPASVMLVVDTGGDLNRAKNVRMSREVATALLSSLQQDHRVAVMQVNHHVELLQPWTSARVEAIKSLDQLLPNKHSVLLKGLLSAVEQFSRIRPGNNHLVLMSDGVDGNGAQPDLTEAYKALIEANITLHVISYASLGVRGTQTIPTRPRVKSAVDPILIDALPSTRDRQDPTPDLKTLMKTKGGALLDIDLLFRKNIKGEMAERAEEFHILTEETGGNLALPASGDAMIIEAHEIAKDINSQYVMSYKPMQPFNATGSTEYRRIEVISRRVGLTVKSRRGYAAKAPR